jgi:hypothetical protein
VLKPTLGESELSSLNPELSPVLIARLLSKGERLKSKFSTAFIAKLPTKLLPLIKD